MSVALQLRHSLLRKLTEATLRELYLQLCGPQITQSGTIEKLDKQHLERQRLKHEGFGRGDRQNKVRRTGAQEQQKKTVARVQGYLDATGPVVHCNEKVIGPEVWDDKEEDRAEFWAGFDKQRHIFKVSNMVAINVNKHKRDFTKSI